MTRSATAWLTKESADASRWFIPIDHEMKIGTRPTTCHRRQQRHPQLPPCLSPDHGIEEGDQVHDEADLREQHQRKPPRTPRGSRYRENARARICGGATAAVRGLDGAPRLHEPGGRPTQSRITGTITATITPRAAAVPSPPGKSRNGPIAATSSGTPMMPPKPRGRSAPGLIAIPRFLVETRGRACW